MAKPAQHFPHWSSLLPLHYRLPCCHLTRFQLNWSLLDSLFATINMWIVNIFCFLQSGWVKLVLLISDSIWNSQSLQQMYSRSIKHTSSYPPCWIHPWVSRSLMMSSCNILTRLRSAARLYSSRSFWVCGAIGFNSTCDRTSHQVKYVSIGQWHTLSVQLASMWHLAHPLPFSFIK